MEKLPEILGTQSENIGSIAHIFSAPNQLDPYNKENILFKKFAFWGEFEEQQRVGLNISSIHVLLMYILVLQASNWKSMVIIARGYRCSPRLNKYVLDNYGECLPVDSIYGNGTHSSNSDNEQPPNTLSRGADEASDCYFPYAIKCAT